MGPRSDFGIRNADFGMQLTQVIKLSSKIRNPRSEIPRRSRDDNSSNIRARCLLMSSLHLPSLFVTVISRILSCLFKFSGKSLMRKTVGDSFELNALYVNIFL